jgi:SAM-dependent methyltransferase
MPPATDPDEAARRLATESLEAADPTGWFERLYAAASDGEAVVPWDRGGPNPLLVEWTSGRDLGDVGRALIVGAGLGGDAEHIARLGPETVAFDVSATAVATARSRHPGSRVKYVTADLLDPPTAWTHAYDLVIESLTVQSLPVTVRRTAVANVAAFVRPGGRLLVIAFAGLDDDAFEGPPWPLSRDDVESFTSEGLAIERLEDIVDADGDAHRWRVEFVRPADPSVPNGGSDVGAGVQRQ